MFQNVLNLDSFSSHVKKLKATESKPWEIVLGLKNLKIKSRTGLPLLWNYVTLFAKS